MPSNRRCLPPRVARGNLGRYVWRNGHRLSLNLQILDGRCLKRGSCGWDPHGLGVESPVPGSKIDGVNSIASQLPLFVRLCYEFLCMSLCDGLLIMTLSIQQLPSITVASWKRFTYRVGNIYGVTSVNYHQEKPNGAFTQKY